MGPVGNQSVLVAGEPIDKNTILSIPCDVLVPAAIEGVINADTAGQVDAKYVVEAANGPTTPEGDKILRERDIIVLPDIYTNGGTLSPLSCLRQRQVFLYKQQDHQDMASYHEKEGIAVCFAVFYTYGRLANDCCMHKQRLCTIAWMENKTA